MGDRGMILNLASLVHALQHLRPGVSEQQTNMIRIGLLSPALPYN